MKMFNLNRYFNSIFVSNSNAECNTRACARLFSVATEEREVCVHTTVPASDFDLKLIYFCKGTYILRFFDSISYNYHYKKLLCVYFLSI